MAAGRPGARLPVVTSPNRAPVRRGRPHASTPPARRVLPDRRSLLLRADPALLIVILAAATAALAYAVFGIRIHRMLHTTEMDLAFFDQILWNTAHGRWFQTTYVPYNFLGQHFELVLLPLAALYRFGAGPQTLIALQALGASFAAVPLYLAGRRLAGRPAGCLVALAYLVVPTLQRGLDFGFHPDLWVPLLAFSALAALVTDRRRLFLVFAGLLLLVKEDMFLVSAALGWICLLRYDRRLGMAVVAGSLLYGAVVLGVAMPALRHGQPGDLVDRYGYLGNTALGVAIGTVIHPDRVREHLTDPLVVKAIKELALTFAFVPLLAPEILVAALPVALVALLSTHDQQRGLDLQYGAPLLAVVTIAAVFGVERIRRVACRLLPRPRYRFIAHWMAAGLAAAIMITSVKGAIRYGPYPHEGNYQSWRFRDDGNAAALARVQRLIPVSAAVTAQTGLAPHLSQRRAQWAYPGFDRADYVVLQDNGIRSNDSEPGFEATQKRLSDLGFGEIAMDGHIHLFVRNVPRLARP